MGQKTPQNCFAWRSETWDSKWFAPHDTQTSTNSRTRIFENPALSAGISRIEIERAANKANKHSPARPVPIGKKVAEIEKLKEEITSHPPGDLYHIHEVAPPDLDAQLNSEMCRLQTAAAPFRRHDRKCIREVRWAPRA